MSLDWSRRSDARELMDDPSVDYATFEGCLRDLAKVNVVTFGHRPTMDFLERLRREGRLNLGRPVRILDAGSGHGDALRAVARWAARRGVAVRLTGVDLNPWSAKAAAAVTPHDAPIRWLTGDVFDHAAEADVIVSSLFTHHLTNGQAIDFLRLMEANARTGWFINDLHRHPLAFALFRPLAAVMRWHRFVRHDGPVSITRAFVAEDWGRLLDEAGVQGAEVRWRFPFRLCVSRVR